VKIVLGLMDFSFFWKGIYQRGKGLFGAQKKSNGRNVSLRHLEPPVSLQCSRYSRGTERFLSEEFIFAAIRASSVFYLGEQRLRFDQYIDGGVLKSMCQVDSSKKPKEKSW